MPKLEQRFDYVKIGLATPDRIRGWAVLDTDFATDVRIITNN
ncbi:hypothetical protein [Okeania sp. SIO3I5]|nr:hypothetical protein [Okeania sp. SIO3I5]